MQPQPSHDALAQQMLLLTLALDHALGREDWEEANALFTRREEILDQMDSLIPTRTSRLILGQVQTLEADMIERVRSMQLSLANDHRQNWEVQRARATYVEPEGSMILDAAS